MLTWPDIYNKTAVKYECKYDHEFYKSLRCAVFEKYSAPLSDDTRALRFEGDYAVLQQMTDEILFRMLYLDAMHWKELVQIDHEWDHPQIMKWTKEFEELQTLIYKALNLFAHTPYRASSYVVNDLKLVLDDMVVASMIYYDCDVTEMGRYGSLSGSCLVDGHSASVERLMMNHSPVQMLALAETVANRRQAMRQRKCLAREAYCRYKLDRTILENRAPHKERNAVIVEYDQLVRDHGMDSSEVRRFKKKVLDRFRRMLTPKAKFHGKSVKYFIELG